MRAGQPEGTAGDLTRSLPARAEVDPADRWRLEDIFPDDAAWEQAYSRLQAEVDAPGRWRGRLGRSAEGLLEALRLRDAQSQVLELLFAYAHMRSDEDTRVASYQGLAARVASLGAQVESAWAFLEPELLALPEGTLRQWVSAPPSGAEGLAVYAHKMDELLRQKPHVLSTAEEELLARSSEMGQAPDNIFGMLNDADLTFPPVHDERGQEVELTKGRFVRLLESTERSVRQEAFTTFYATYARQRNTLGATLAAAVKRDWFYAQSRHYGSAVEAALDQDNIPLAVYDNLVAVVREHLPLLHRYLRLRRRVLGLERLHMYDLYVRLVEEPEAHVPYADAVRTVERGLAPLGEDYLKRFRQGLAGGWVDIYENQGKTGGAYSWGVYGVHPFVLLNYQGNIDHVFTIAHEFGHALHSELTQARQPYPYARYSIFVAEVASTVNEALLMAHLLEEAPAGRQRAYLVNHYLEEFRGTLFRQVMFAEFERRIHEEVERGGALTADSLSSIYRALNLDYYGPEVEVDQEIDLEWARIPHFYRAYYVYKYATGFSAAQALASALRGEGPAARERYLEFLRGGSSRYPVELLRGAGVDMASPQPVRQALAVFAGLVQELEGLLA